MSILPTVLLAPTPAPCLRLYPVPLWCTGPSLHFSIFPLVLSIQACARCEFWHVCGLGSTSSPWLSGLATQRGSLLTSGAAGMPDGPIHHPEGQGGGNSDDYRRMYVLVDFFFGWFFKSMMTWERPQRETGLGTVKANIILCAQTQKGGKKTDRKIHSVRQ